MIKERPKHQVTLIFMSQLILETEKKVMSRGEVGLEIADSSRKVFSINKTALRSNISKTIFSVKCEVIVLTLDSIVVLTNKLNLLKLMLNYKVKSTLFQMASLILLLVGTSFSQTRQINEGTMMLLLHRKFFLILSYSTCALNHYSMTALRG